MIYTSYFANIRKLPPTVTPVGICLSPPFWFRGVNYDKLAPKKDLLSDYKAGRCNMTEYWERYLHGTLSSLNPQIVIHELSSLGTPDIAMCCYETPSDFCHRFICAHWITQTTGIVIREYGQDQTTIFGG